MHQTQRYVPEYLAWELDDACAACPELARKLWTQRVSTFPKNQCGQRRWSANLLSADPTINCSARVALLLTRETAWWQLERRGVTRKRIRRFLDGAAISARSRTGRRQKGVLKMPPFLLEPTFKTLGPHEKYFFELVCKRIWRLWYFHLRSGLKVNARLSNA